MSKLKLRDSLIIILNLFFYHLNNKKQWAQELGKKLRLPCFSPNKDYIQALIMLNIRQIQSKFKNEKIEKLGKVMP